jgi:hypothetical protein
VGRRYEFNFGTEKSGRSGGRVDKDQFSIDGRSWDHRNPYNQRAIDKANQNREKGRYTVNPSSDKKFDALYDYDFGRVRDAAKELGIGNVNSKKEVRKILNYIQGNSKQKNEEPKKEEPSQSKPEYEYKPVGDPPSQGDKDGGTASPEPLEAAPRLSGFTDNPSKDAIRGGDDMNDWYQKKFIPHLKAEADFGTASIDNDMGFYLENFAYGPPELGDATELFDKYKKKIDKAAD